MARKKNLGNLSTTSILESLMVVEKSFIGKTLSFHGEILGQRVYRKVEIKSVDIGLMDGIRKIVIFNKGLSDMFCLPKSKVERIFQTGSSFLLEQIEIAILLNKEEDVLKSKGPIGSGETEIRNISE